MAITAIVQIPPLMPNPPYDVVRDLQPLAQVASANSLLPVPKAAPFKDLKDFIAQVKTNPRKTNYGVGTTSHTRARC